MARSGTALSAAADRLFTVRIALPACVAGLTILALLLRLHDLTAQSLWRDEVTSWQQARLDLGGLLAATAADNYPPLFNLLLHGALALFGDTPFALRLPSALLGTLTVPALCWTGTQLGGRRAGLVAAALLCVSGFHLWYSQEARMYALLGLTTTLYAGTVTRYAVRPTGRWAVASVLAGAALLYSHPYGTLNWLSLTLAATLLPSAAAGWRARVQRLAVAALGLLLFLPWGLLLLGRAKAIDAAGFWILPVSPGRVLYYLEQLVTGPFMLGAVAFGTLVALLSLFGPKRNGSTAGLEPSEGGAGLAFVLIWAALPLALGTLASLLAEPILYPRYLIGSLPALLLLLGIGAARLPRGLVRYVGLAGLAFAGFTGFIGYGPPDRDDFRDLAAALAGEAQPGDCVVMDPLSQIAMSYYARDGFACLSVTDHPGAAVFPQVPRRILAIVNPDDGLPDTDTSSLGTTIDTKSFGDLSLKLVSPKPVSN